VGIDLRFVVVVLLIVWGTLAVGIVPVLLGWISVFGQWRSTGNHTVPTGLSALTASICVMQVGDRICRALTSYTRGASPVYLLWCAFFALEFLLDLAALILALRVRNVTSRPVLIGSSAIAAINITGLIWLLIIIVPSLSS